MKTVTLTVTCEHCTEDYPVTVNPADVQRWQDGVMIQDALPYLSADERELLISLTCRDCWDEIWDRFDD